MTDLFAYPNTPGAQASDTSRAAIGCDAML